MSAETISTPRLPAIASVSWMLSAPRSEAQTRPTCEPCRQSGDLMDELDVARPDQHRDDRHASGDQGLGLVGMERRRRDEVVVEPVEPLGQVVEERAFGFDHAGELVDQPLGVVAGVGAGALGEQDADEGAGSLALGRGGEGRRGHLVGGEARVRGAAQHLGDDPGKRLRPAALRRPIGDVGPRTVAAGDVAGVGEAAIDGPDRVRVDAQGGAQLPDGRQPGAGQEPAGIDLVGELPEDLGRDRDVRIALDVERSDRASRQCGWYLIIT